jgi:hypothetical protein
MKPRLWSQPARGLSVLGAFGLFVGLGLIAGCGSSPPPLPPAIPPAEAEPAQTKVVRQGNRSVKISVRDHDNESISQRFRRQAREAREKAGR